MICANRLTQLARRGNGRYSARSRIMTVTERRAMPLQGPKPHTANPLKVVLTDMARQRRATVPFPPGDTSFSLRRTRQVLVDPLPLLLDAYYRYGPVFTLRLLQGKVVW